MDFDMRSVRTASAALCALFALSLTFLGCSGGTGQVKLPTNPKAGDKLTVNIRGAKLTFRYCPPGEFTMNVVDFSDKYLPDIEEEKDEDGNETVPETPVTVKITRGFWIQETELTRKQAVAISGKKDYSRSKYDDGVPANNGDYPFWGSRSDFEGLLKELNSDGSIVSENMTPHEKIRPDGWKFELPTEAEWEYASRAGSNDPEPDGECDMYAWSKENSNETAHKVASKKANKWGLYDMRGNMWERVRIPYDNMRGDMPDQQIFEDDGALHDPDNLHGRFEIVRGGGIAMAAKDCKSDTWSYFEGRWSPLSFQGDVGGRLALFEEESILKPNRKQIVRETGFSRWRRLRNEESNQRLEEMRQRVIERRQREQEEMKKEMEANPDAFKTPAQRMQEQMDEARRKAEEEQAAMERREIENVMRDNPGMTEAQAKEFLAKQRADALKKQEEFDKAHGLDKIEDNFERSRRRAEIQREEFEKNREEMEKRRKEMREKAGLPQNTEFEKRVEESRKKFEERAAENRRKFEERVKQREEEDKKRQEEFEKEFEEMRKRARR